jgi:hypothetical protein
MSDGPYPNADSLPVTVTNAAVGTQLPDIACNRVMIQLDPDASDNVEICYNNSFGGGVVVEPGEVWTGRPANLKMVWARANGAASELLRVTWEKC